MKISILFVSTGDVCRSPMAAGALRSILRRAGAEDLFEIDSAGISDAHVGRPPGILAIEAAMRRGYEIWNERARLLTAMDLTRFSWPLAMDRTHLAAMRERAPHGFVDRPQMFLKFAPRLGIQDIADPYGGTTEDYERALDLIEGGCIGFLEHLRNVMKSSAGVQIPPL